MESARNHIPIEISISELDVKTTVTMRDLRKKINTSPSSNLGFQGSLFNIEVPKNLKKFANIKKIYYYIEKTSLDLSNPLHLSWLCFIFVQMFQIESKIVVSTIKINISNPIIGY